MDLLTVAPAIQMPAHSKIEDPFDPISVDINEFLVGRTPIDFRGTGVGKQNTVLNVDRRDVVFDIAHNPGILRADPTAADGPGFVGGKDVVVILIVEHPGEGQLPEVVHAGDRVGSVLGF